MDPSFFEGLATTTNYRDITSSYELGTHNGESTSELDQYPIPVSSALLDTLNWPKVANIGISYVVQKNTDGEFQYPYQGNFLAQQQGRKGCLHQLLLDPPSRIYLSIYQGDLENVGTRERARSLYGRTLKKVGLRKKG